MTSPETSEEEISAAKPSICMAHRSGFLCRPDQMQICMVCTEWTRAALTAAAQVRAQALADNENRIASPAQEAEFATYVENVARALHEAHMPYCDYTYPFDDPMSSSKMYRDLARAVTLVRGPSTTP